MLDDVDGKEDEERSGEDVGCIGASRSIFKANAVH